MQRWELKVVSVSWTVGYDRTKRWIERVPSPTGDKDTDSQFTVAKQAAADGWELVAVVPIVIANEYTGGSVTNEMKLFFKRPLP